MGLWALLTGAKAIDTVADNATTIVKSTCAGLDKIWYTDEEKADTALKFAGIDVEVKKQASMLFLEHQKIVASESTTRSITRRILAVMVMTTELGLLLGAAVAWKFDPIWAKFLLELAGTLSYGFMAIIIFYFGYYSVTNIIGAVGGKKAVNATGD